MMVKSKVIAKAKWIALQDFENGNLFGRKSRDRVNVRIYLFYLYNSNK